jgi:hypothetical protein
MQISLCTPLTLGACNWTRLSMSTIDTSSLPSTKRVVSSAPSIFDIHMVNVHKDILRTIGKPHSSVAYSLLSNILLDTFGYLNILFCLQIALPYFNVSSFSVWISSYENKNWVIQNTWQLASIVVGPKGVADDCVSKSNSGFVK